MMSEKILGYETCSICGKLFKTADLVPAHVPQRNLGLDLEELILCEKCYSQFREVICKSCAQFYYVTEEMLDADDEIRQVVASGLCPRCYVKSNEKV